MCDVVKICTQICPQIVHSLSTSVTGYGGDDYRLPLKGYRLWGKARSSSAAQYYFTHRKWYLRQENMAPATACGGRCEKTLDVLQACNKFIVQRLFEKSLKGIFLIS